MTLPCYMFCRYISCGLAINNFIVSYKKAVPNLSREENKVKRRNDNSVTSNICFSVRERNHIEVKTDDLESRNSRTIIWQNR